MFLGRFVAFARALVPGLAGMSGLRYRTFLFFNAVGGMVWGIGYTLLGFVVGLSFQRILTQVGLWSVAVVAAVVIVAVVVRWLLKRRQRQRLAAEPDADGHPVEDWASSDRRGGQGSAG